MIINIRRKENESLLVYNYCSGEEFNEENKIFILKNELLLCKLQI